MTRIIRSTIISVFDFYSGNFKKIYSVGITFVILSLLFSLILSTSITYVFMEYFLTDDSMYDGFVVRIFSNPVLSGRLVWMLFSFSILNLSLFAIFYRRADEENFSGKYTFRNFYQSLRDKELHQFLFFLFILILINFLLYKDIFNVTGRSNDSIFHKRIDLLSESGYRMNIWLNYVVRAIKASVPYIFAILMVIYSYWGKLSLRIIVSHGKTILVSIMLLYFAVIFAKGAAVDIHLYFLSVLSIPFKNALIPGLIGLAIYVLLIGFFLPVLAGLLVYPVKYSEVEIEVQEESDILS